MEKEINIAELYKPKTIWNFQPLNKVIAEATDINWIIEGWVAEGHVTIIAGSPKLGKSLIQLNIGMSVSQGSPFIGIESQQKKVALVSAEDGSPILHNRIKIMREIPNNNFLVDFGGKRLDKMPNIISLKEKIKEEKIGLLMLDPYIRFHEADESSPEAAKAIYYLKDVAAETGAGIIIAHHNRKSGGEYGNEIRGSSAIFGAVDLAITLKRKLSEKNQIKVSFIGRICASQEPLILTLGDDLHWICKGTSSEISQNESDDLVLECLDLENGTKWTELIDQTKKAKSSLSKILDRLVENEKACKGEDGLWYKK